MASIPRKRPATASVAVAPVYITQHTAVSAAGFKTPRAFLEFVAQHGVTSARSGKTVHVRVEDLRAKFAELATLPVGQVANSDNDSDVDETPTTADAVLAELGLRRAGETR